MRDVVENRSASLEAVLSRATRRASGEANWQQLARELTLSANPRSGCRVVVGSPRRSAHAAATTVLLARLLADDHGREVILVEGTPPGIMPLLDGKASRSGLLDSLGDRNSPRRHLQSVAPGLQLLTIGNRVSGQSGLLSPDRLRAFFAQEELQGVDLLVSAGGFLQDDTALAWALAADRCLLLAEENTTRSREMHRALDVVRAVPKDRLGLVLATAS
jgi:Mrp family chromosome partitioning ATPase